MSRVLFVTSQQNPPETNREKNKFYFLSKITEGDVLLGTWHKDYASAKICEEELNRQSPKIRYHVIPIYKYPTNLRSVVRFYKFIQLGLQLKYRDGLKFSNIHCYGHTSTALISLILKFFLGAKLNVMIAGSPSDNYLYDDENFTFLDKIKKFYSDVALHLALFSSDNTELIYKRQLSSYPLLKNIPNVIIHPFVPTTYLSTLVENRSEPTENYILSLGFPWYLKGFDVLVKAFNLISKDYPDLKLKLVGYNSDTSKLKELAGANKNIEILKPVYHDEAIDLIKNSRIFVLMSRTESFPRSAIEAMALGVPVILSDVAGNPEYIKNEINGILIASGNEELLSLGLKKILDSKDFENQLRTGGQKFTLEKLTEGVYVQEFEKLI